MDLAALRFRRVRTMLLVHHSRNTPNEPRVSTTPTIEKASECTPTVDVAIVDPSGALTTISSGKLPGVFTATGNETVDMG